jgi:hypothetical protein
MPQIEMLPKAVLFLRQFAVCLCEPLTQAQDSLVDILLEFHWVVKGVPRLKGIGTLSRQFPALDKPLKRASRLIVRLDFLGTRPDLAFEFLGGHEEIEQRGQRRIHGGRQRLFRKPFKAVIAGVFPDDRPVFCSTKQLPFFLWSLERVKGRRSFSRQISAAWLINSEPLSRRLRCR